MKVGDYEGSGAFEAVYVGPGEYLPGRFVPAEPPRTLDPIRGAALTAAVKLACADIAADRLSTKDGILDLACTFERYLTGEEAND